MKKQDDQRTDSAAADADSRRVTAVGGGQMGRALIGGMLASGVVQADRLSIVERNPNSQTWWAEHHPAVTVKNDLPGLIPAADVVLLAVKPYAIADVAAQMGQICDDQKLLVSVAAGVPLQSICKAVGHERVVRVMPNTPSLVGAGASAFCVARSVSQADCGWIEHALQSVGVAAQVSEPQMDAVTGVSGSGPAYICLVIEALADGGVLAGLPRPLAMKFAAQTVLGTAKMVMETGRHPGELKDAVASPGGTTIAALQVLENNGLRAALINAVQASANRSKELS
ncbi:pyrroline-5-carboxylate reductase [Stieleria sp. TO1_6]|uniref:pyrroline-5-carboxylate reductase n=1 Tax=Stieleria tagensis TaxID=2956795 RepID=UPI00209AE6C0|nr:pyrroline-5-carboxylate reductase [Stieleria tagensis]MCO8125486.1 pyrroline-5-carboxylate reductase [Stieleria tagensis]